MKSRESNSMGSSSSLNSVTRYMDETVWTQFDLLSDTFSLVALCAAKLYISI